MKKVISASVTPLLEDGSLDRQGLCRILERNIRHGIDGVFLFGSMGEWGSFDAGFKRDAIALAADCVRGRMEVLAGVNATSVGLTLRQMDELRGIPFDAYVYMLPCKTSSLDPVRSILRVLDHADRPVYYYHCPPNNGITLSTAQFAQLLRHPNLKGIKNSASDMVLRRELLLLRRDMGAKALFFEGQEWSADEAMFVGLDGVICGMGALCSKMIKKIAVCADAGDFAGASAAQEALIRVFHGVYGPALQNVWNGQKYALQRLGLIASPLTLAQEMDSLTPEACARIDACLEEYRAELD